MEPFTPLEQNLAVSFRDRSLLARALTHRSYLNENPDTVLQDNERLEFLGDAVLDFVVGAYLYHHYPEMHEGELTALRAALVRSETLADFARQMQVGSHLRLGYGEAENGGRERIPLLCAAFEAIVGAIYLDQGLAAVQQLMDGLMAPALKEILASASHIDAKSEFQVWAQARFNITPRYRVVEATGPDHDKTFTIQVLVGEEAWGEGRGRSKQLAAQAAARQALLQAEAIEDLEDVA
ncbi:MAG: ribonuclease III [Anaerolineales bacterium]|nr:ribonuclease III [Anaerolineales bacterium]